MNTELLAKLDSLDTRNAALAMLSENPELIDQTICEKLMEIIAQPESIENTNRFASLIEETEDPAFIQPLIDKVSTAKLEKAPWLADYLYALVMLLDEREEAYPAEDTLVHRLGDWLLHTGGGEISWKSGDILSNLSNPNTQDYLTKGALDQRLFHLTRIACLSGIMNLHREHAPALLEKLLNDPNEEIRESAKRAEEFLQRASTD
ncbi:hypothetical protein [Rubritalea squalenifaciens]|uniref:hypothetical protein n=1 Tax=Rubritalea squalenifaciens TaxID=407226 RepID=UPI001160FFEE|nr:hypothetical protein [Rubritalea squalenifaciens]